MMDRRTSSSIFALLFISMIWLFISSKDLCNPNYMLLSDTISYEFPHKAEFTKSLDGNTFYLKIKEVGLKFPIIDYYFLSKNEMKKLINSSKDSKSTKFIVSEINGDKYAYDIVISENTYFSSENVEASLKRERWLTWFFLILSFLTLIFGMLLIISKKSNPRANCVRPN